MYVLANNSNVCVGKQFCLSCTHVIFRAILLLFFLFITFQYEIVGSVFHWHVLHHQCRWCIQDNTRVPNELFCRSPSRLTVYCNISFKPIDFFSLRTRYSKIVGNVYILRTTSSSCVPTRCIYLCFCKFMPFYTHGWCIEATDRDLTKTLNRQTNYPAV